MAYSDLVFAHTLADFADTVAMNYFDRTSKSEVKADGTLVTTADRAIEHGVRKRIQAYNPCDSVLAEEFGGADTIAHRLWIIDPLDQTVNFSRGLREFATLIALSDPHGADCAVITAPALKQRWWAVTGRGAFNRKGPISVSAVDELTAALVSLAAPHRFSHHGLLHQTHAVADAAAATTGNGGFYAQMMLAEGRVDATLDPWGQRWDTAASSIIIAEAGGKMTTLTGQTPAIGSALATNGKLHQPISNLLEESHNRSVLPG